MAERTIVSDHGFNTPGYREEERRLYRKRRRIVTATATIALGATLGLGLEKITDDSVEAKEVNIGALVDAQIEAALESGPTTEERQKAVKSILGERTLGSVIAFAYPEADDATFQEKATTESGLRIRQDRIANTGFEPQPEDQILSWPRMIDTNNDQIPDSTVYLAQLDDSETL